MDAISSSAVLTGVVPAVPGRECDLELISRRLREGQFRFRHIGAHCADETDAYDIDNLLSDFNH